MSTVFIDDLIRKENGVAIEILVAPMWKISIFFAKEKSEKITFFKKETNHFFKRNHFLQNKKFFEFLDQFLAKKVFCTFFVQSVVFELEFNGIKKISFFKLSAISISKIQGSDKKFNKKPFLIKID